MATANLRYGMDALLIIYVNAKFSQHVKIKF